MALNKFGVSIDGNRGILQPKLKYKFRVAFFNFGQSATVREFTSQVVSVDRPKIAYEEVPIHSYNSIAYSMGKHTWQTINASIRDDVTNKVVESTGQQIQRQVDHHNQTSALSGADYKFGMRVDVMTGAHDAILEQWALEGCFLTNVDYDGGDYAASEPLVVALTVRFDNALHFGSSKDTQLTSPAAAGGQTTGSIGNG